MNPSSILGSSTPHILEPYPDVTPVFYIAVVTNSISIDASEGLPDGHPFVVGTGASMLGAKHLNRYLLAALRNGAYNQRSLVFYAPNSISLLTRLNTDRIGGVTCL